MSLNGATVVIIGGSSGIGLAIGKAARSAGASVVIASRSNEKLARAQAELGDVRTFAVDITNEDAVHKLFQRIDHLDHLVVSAAQVIGGRILDADTTRLRPSVDSRFWGSLYATKYAAPKMTAGGSITFFSGVSAWKPYVGESVGAASAGAMEAFARTLAVELAPIRVNVLCPGFIDTPLLDTYLGSGKQQFLNWLTEKLPVKRPGRPEDIAEGALFLMTNGYTTGITLHIDGGYPLV